VAANLYHCRPRRADERCRYRPQWDIWFGIFGGGVWQVDADQPLDANFATNFKQPNSSLMWVQNPTRPQDFEYVVVQDVVVDRQGRVWAANAFADSGAVIAWNDHDCWGRFDANDGITSNSRRDLSTDSSVLVGYGNIGVMKSPRTACSAAPVIQIPPRATDHFRWSAIRSRNLITL
jgi:hypothetical protein